MDQQKPEELSKELVKSAIEKAIERVNGGADSDTVGDVEENSAATSTTTETTTTENEYYTIVYTSQGLVRRESSKTKQHVTTATAQQLLSSPTSSSSSESSKTKKLKVSSPPTPPNSSRREEASLDKSCFQQPVDDDETMAISDESESEINLAHESLLTRVRQKKISSLNTNERVVVGDDEEHDFNPTLIEGECIKTKKYKLNNSTYTKKLIYS